MDEKIEQEKVCLTEIVRSVAVPEVDPIVNRFDTRVYDLCRSLVGFMIGEEGSRLALEKISSGALSAPHLVYPEMAALYMCTGIAMYKDLKDLKQGKYPRTGVGVLVGIAVAVGHHLLQSPAGEQMYHVILK